ncbi:DUF3500 domain-containing protein [Chachezhania antarctica]|uniref:DUF3500 domain-containing protein n=1 Tax=Chachezhania antarctica TaxID=2340860 RepID=UPI000EB48FF8|nr:DUF3500 domain-containing protein [Chachezhania antarctica]
MNRKLYLTASALAGALAISAVTASAQPIEPPAGETVALPLADVAELASANATAEAIVAAAQDFLDTLDAHQRESVMFAFDDNTQRARWSNLPDSLSPRAGLSREDMSEDQRAALDSLLAQVLSADGVRNETLQRHADGQLTDGGPIGNGDTLEFGEDLYYASILGQPETNAPWMLQYGGHHLAINATFAGGQASFSPMLTGGQPLTVDYDGETVYITREEVQASRDFLATLDEDQRASAIVSDQPAQLLLGPGAHGTTIAPEGISGADLSDAQQEALLAVIEARIGQLNDRDAGAVMDKVRETLDQTTFGWWGPQEPFGAAYLRVVGPTIVLEYSPQSMGSDGTEHTHNMYRDPTNDYGSAWVGAE